MDENKLFEIHESLQNNKVKNMVEQINEYGLISFWQDYSDFLDRIEYGYYKQYY